MASEYDKTQARVEKGLAYRFWRKAEERPRHADQFSQVTDKPVFQACPRDHDFLAYAGPPHAPLPRRYVCVDCKEVATEDELRELGFKFDHTPDFVIKSVMNARLQERQKHPNGKFLFFARR